jgi:23S rRNA pseudoU1915 N3-methylase RlmH
MNRPMKRALVRVFYFAISTLIVAIGIIADAAPAVAQKAEMRQRVDEIKQAAVQNKQALAQYTWLETLTTTLKGEQKGVERSEVRMGPDGQPEKTPLGVSGTQEAGGGRLKRLIVEKKKEEYKDYAERIKSLIQRYVPPDRDKLADAYQSGNILMGPQAGGAQYRLVISNYVKQSDKMTLVIDKAQKQIVSLSIATYLDSPQDAVNVNVQFASIAGGPNHVSQETIDGVSKQLRIDILNSEYRKI